MSGAREAASEARRLVNGFRAYQSMVVACRIELPDLLAAEPRTVEELASVTGTHAPSLHRLLRGLVALRVFTQDSDGRFHSTAVSDWFRSDRPGLRDVTLMLSEEGYMAWTEALHAVRTGQPVFERVHGKTRWEHLAEDPAAAAAFNAAMVEMTSRVGRAFASTFDFADARTVVDVGGGNGALLTAILKARPDARGVLFDLPAGLEGARQRLREDEVADRVEIVAGSFFDTVPAGADLYLLKSIVHDWEEPKALKILRTCRSAMTAPGSRLVLIERTLPEVIDDPDAALGILMSDLQMMVVLGGRERMPAEYGELLAAAGLHMTRHVPFDSEYGAVESVVA